jgi:hypothetical protein
VLIRNVSERAWVWPFDEDGPQRVEPGEVYEVSDVPMRILPKQPGEPSALFRERLADAARKSGERIALLRSLFHAGMMRSVPPDPETMH